MPTPTYENVLPLVSRSDLQGRVLSVVFECPVTQKKIPARAYMRSNDNTLKGRVGRSVQQSVMWELRNVVNRSISQAFGHGMVGNVARRAAQQAAYGGMRTAEQRPVITKESKQATLLEAFRSVSREFKWDPDERRWVSADLKDVVHPFNDQLTSHPIDAPYDRGVMIRMLAEVASADGTLSREEKDYLFDIHTAELEGLETVLRRPKLTPVDLEEVNEGAHRDSMLLLAWAVAFTDESLDAAERQRIVDFSEGLGIPLTRAAELKRVAQSYVIEQFVELAYANGGLVDNVSRQAQEIARRIEFDPVEAQRVEIRHRKKRGILG